MGGVNAPQEIARALLAARASGDRLDAYPGAMPQSMAEAYAIQDAAIALDGRAVGGWKVGRIPPNLVGRFGDSRLAGPIFADEIVEGDEPAMPVYADGFAAAEAELLLLLGDIGTRDYDIDTVRACITEVRVGIEIASSPFAAINRNGPAVTASDYGNNKGLILGPRLPDWRTVNLRTIPVEMIIDGERIAAATMEAMLDGPFGSVLFLIRVLRERNIAIAPGTWVSAGAITGVHEVRPGQRGHALFGGYLRAGFRIQAV